MITIEVPDCNWRWPVLSNEFVLVVSISLFLVFAIAELIGALASDSLSLLGDSICMFVDVSSYICNTYVEWYKTRNGRVTFGSRILTEIVVPTLSVLSLLAVTVYITVDAMSVVRNPPLTNSVNVAYLYTFSFFNLLVDIVSNFLFILKGDDAFHEEAISIPQLSLDTSISQDVEEEFGRLEDDDLIWDRQPINNNNRLTNGPSSPRDNGINQCRQQDGIFTRFCRSYCCGCCFWSHSHTNHQHVGGRKSNLNMLSAFSHVLGDTFRTLSTFSAAIISTLSGIDGDICDAWAAIVVSITIVLLCSLLLWEIKDAALEIWNEDCRDVPTTPTAGKTFTFTIPAKRSDSGASKPKHAYQRVAEAEDASIII